MLFLCVALCAGWLVVAGVLDVFVVVLFCVCLFLCWRCVFVLVVVSCLMFLFACACAL